MAQYYKAMGFHHRITTPEDAQANDFAETFMKVLVKLLRTAVVEKTDPKRTVQRYLMAYHATPHRMTGKSLAELMFGCQIIKKNYPECYQRPREGGQRGKADPRGGEVKAEGLHGCQAGCQGKGDEGSG